MMARPELVITREHSDSRESGNQRGQEDGLQGITVLKGAAGSGGEAALKANAIRALVDLLFVGFQGQISHRYAELKGDLFRGTRVQLTMEDGIELQIESLILTSSLAELQPR